MKRSTLPYLATPLAIALLFWHSLAAVALAVPCLLLFLHSRGLFRRLWNTRLRWKHAAQLAGGSTAEPQEPTMITQVARAPHELLGVGPDAGTGTIFRTFHEQMKAKTNEDLRLNRQGRRLTAAKNAMMARRRKKRQGVRAESSRPEQKAEAESSMQALLESRPVYEGKVIQFKNLPSSVVGKYEVGKEIEGIGLGTAAEPARCNGRGRHRFVIHSRSGRLIDGAGTEGQVAFLPGTRFVITSREPWQNPDYPEGPEGFTFELREVA